MNRRQIREGLEGVPIESLLLGSQSKDKTLTPRQKEFARRVAMGDTSKAQAYRDTYNTKGIKKSQANNASKLSLQSGVAMEIQAYQAAIEAAKYRTPAQLREFVIHQLTIHAMNEDINPAQRIKSLELLGKVSEVAAFTERKETTVINQSGDIKQRLLAMISGQATDVSHKDILSPGSKQSLARSQSIDLAINPVSDNDQAMRDEDVDSLLAEIRGDGCAESEDGDTTPTPPPQMASEAQGRIAHTIPHNESTLESNMETIDNIEQNVATVTSYSLKSNIEDSSIDDLDIKEGVGGSKNVWKENKEDIDVSPPSSFRVK
jgi:hypothetical protein